MPPIRRLPWLLASAHFALYCTVSINRHRQMRSTGFDLGIFEQAVRAYAEFRAPVAELKGSGFNLLGDHFHPILVVLAPFYRLAPSPVTLLIAQAALLAVSTVPICRLAATRLGHWQSAAIGVAYGLSWGILKAVEFDFHEVSFAVPLLAFSGEALATGRWRAAAAWALPLLLVKEDLAATVTVIGCYIFAAGSRRLGAIVAAVAIAVGTLVVLVILPALSYWGHYTYLETVQTAQGTGPLRLLLPTTKLWTVLMLLVPTAFVAPRSPLLVLVLPTLAWRFWSTGPNYWGTDFHYNAVLMPVVFLALVDGVHRMAPRARRVAAVAVPVVAYTIAVAGFGPGPTPRELVRPTVYRVPPAIAPAREALRSIPDGVDVAAANRLAPQLTSRCRVYQFPGIPNGAFRPPYVAVTTDSDQDAVAALITWDYTVLARGGDVIVLKSVSAVFVPPVIGRRSPAGLGGHAWEEVAGWRRGAGAHGRRRLGTRDHAKTVIDRKDLPVRGNG